MTASTLPILRSKLHRPVSGNDAMERADLMERLNGGLNRALTLISTPVGFGKTTLAGQWAKSLEHEWCCCWYAVDASDDSLRVFLLYVVSAIRLEEPDACPESLLIAQSETLPEPSMVARVFINEVLDLKKKVFFVIDDFHRLSDPSILEFLNTLLSYPPPQFPLGDFNPTRPRLGAQ